MATLSVAHISFTLVWNTGAGSMSTGTLRLWQSPREGQGATENGKEGKGEFSALADYHTRRWQLVIGMPPACLLYLGPSSLTVLSPRVALLPLLVRRPRRIRVTWWPAFMDTTGAWS